MAPGRCAPCPKTLTCRACCSCACPGACARTPRWPWVGCCGKCHPTCAACSSPCTLIPCIGRGWKSGGAIASSPWLAGATNTSTAKPLPATIMTPPTPPTSDCSKLEVALKTLWGASRWPGFDDSTLDLAPAPAQEACRRLHQLVSVRASGIVHGPHGVGKSFLLHHWSQQLSPKQYRLLRLNHATLMGSDLLRQLVSLAGKKPQYRRGDNVLLLSALWQEWAPVWPVLIVEEAQDLNTAALEELRLLTCARPDTQSPFCLILVGDPDLLPRLDLGINRALMSRLGFCLRLDPWPKETLEAYLYGRLAEVGIHASP